MKKRPVMSLATAILILGSFAFLEQSALASTPQKLSQFPEGERLVYGRLVDAYHRNQWQEVVKERELLERNYPLSIHLDNAYYLTGLMEFQQNRLGEALRSFSTVRDRYEKSHKRASALFAIAMTYNRLKLVPQSHRVLDQLLKEYPGSPESKRAWMQLRIEKEKQKPASHKG